MTRRFYHRSNQVAVVARSRRRVGAIACAVMLGIVTCDLMGARSVNAGTIAVEVYDTEGAFTITKENWWVDANTLAVHETGTLGTWDMGVRITGEPTPGGLYTIDLDKYVEVHALWKEFTIELGTGLGDQFVPSTPSDGMFFHYNSVPPPKDASGYFDLDLANSNQDLYTFVRNDKPVWIRPNGDPKPSQFWFRLTVPDAIDGVVDGEARFTIRQGPHFHNGEVPEPATLFLVGIAGLFWFGRRRVRQQHA